MDSKCSPGLQLQTRRVFWRLDRSAENMSKGALMANVTEGEPSAFACSSKIEKRDLVAQKPD